VIDDQKSLPRESNTEVETNLEAQSTVTTSTKAIVSHTRPEIASEEQPKKRGKQPTKQWFDSQGREWKYINNIAGLDLVRNEKCTLEFYDHESEKYIPLVVPHHFELRYDLAPRQMVFQLIGRDDVGTPRRTKTKGQPRKKKKASGIIQEEQLPPGKQKELARIMIDVPKIEKEASTFVSVAVSPHKYKVSAQHPPNLPRQIQFTVSAKHHAMVYRPADDPIRKMQHYDSAYLLLADWVAKFNKSMAFSTKSPNKLTRSFPHKGMTFINIAQRNTKPFKLSQDCFHFLTLARPKYIMAESDMRIQAIPQYQKPMRRGAENIIRLFGEASAFVDPTQNDVLPDQVWIDGEHNDDRNEEEIFGPKTNRTLKLATKFAYKKVDKMPPPAPEGTGFWTPWAVKEGETDSILEISDRRRSLREGKLLKKEQRLKNRVEAAAQILAEYSSGGDGSPRAPPSDTNTDGENVVQWSPVRARLKGQEVRN